MLRPRLTIFLASLAVLAGLNGAVGEQIAHSNPGKRSHRAFPLASKTSKRVRHAGKHKSSCPGGKTQTSRRRRSCGESRITKARKSQASTSAGRPVRLPAATPQNPIATTTAELPPVTTTDPTVASIVPWKARQRQWPGRAGASTTTSAAPRASSMAGLPIPMAAMRHALRAAAFIRTAPNTASRTRRPTGSTC